jgi:uracil-DNA glycosylase family 4
MKWLQPEVNNPAAGGVLVVARDPGSREMALGKPLVGDAGMQFNDCLQAAGIARSSINVHNIVSVQPPGNEFHLHRPEDIARGYVELEALVARLRPNIIVAMGNEASFTCCTDWPAKDGTVMTAKDIHKRRGYIWPGRFGAKVLTTLHPSAVMRDASGISAMLATHDLEKAWNHRHTASLDYDPMHVRIIRSPADAQNAMHLLRGLGVLACDIEITDEHPFKCACVAFAGTCTDAYVFTPGVLQYAFQLLEDPSLTTVWQNGQFDLHFLLTRHNVRVATALDDIIVAWHTRWPEIAGAKTDLQGNKKGGAKQTRKSLAFFASLYANVQWWKDYDFKTVDEKYVLNGKDACLTLKAHYDMQAELHELDLQGVYKMSVQRIWPVVEMQRTGMLVNEARRRDTMQQLQARAAAARHRIAELARPLIEARRDRLSKPTLIFERHVCHCCRNGKGKRASCWGCAGWSEKPTLQEMQSAYKKYILGNGGTPQEKAKALSSKVTKKILEASLLKPCKICSGKGEWEEYAFNPASNEQMSMLLFDVLRLPRRSGVDESSLKGILGTLSEMHQVPMQVGAD